MADTFRPVDYQPLDFMPGTQLIMAARRAHAAEDMAKENAATQRMFAENTAKRESASAARESARHTMELEDRAHRQEVERANMLLPTSALMRAARQVGAGGANAIGKPYGISFEEEKAPPPSLHGTDLFKAAGNAYGNFAKDTLASPTRSDTGGVDVVSGGASAPTALPPGLANKFLVSGGASGMSTPGNVDLSARPDITNPDGSHSSVRSMSFGSDGKEVLVPTVGPRGVMSDDEAIRQYDRTGQHLGMFDTSDNATAYAQRLHEQQAGAMGAQPVTGMIPDGVAATPETSESPLDQVQQQLEHPQARPSKLFAAAGGQRFEVPTVSDSTGLGDKYDQVYNEILRRTGDEGKAYTAVLHMREKDDVAAAAGSRLTQNLDSRADLADTYKRDVGEQDARDRFMADEAMKRTIAAGKYKVAAAGPGFKQEGANDRVTSLLDRRAKAVRETAQFGKLVAADKTVRSIVSNLASNLPLAHSDAQIAIARFFRQAQPTEGEMHQLYSNLGGWTDKFDQFKAKVMNGDLSPEQLRQMRGSAKLVAKEHQEDKHNFAQVARSYLGPKSGLDMMPDQAQQLYQGMLAEIGVDANELPPLYETEGGITLGTGKAPSVRPRQKPPAGTAPDHEDDNAFLNRVLK